MIPPKSLLSAVSEGEWTEIANEIVKALDLDLHAASDFKRLKWLYQRCLMCVTGLQDNREDAIALEDLHKCVLAAIQIVDHRWPNVTPKHLQEELGKTVTLASPVTAQAINIAVCLWLSIDCVAPKHSMPREWPEGDTIQRFVLGRRFDDPLDASVGDSITRFPPKFRASRLKSISGVDIETTYYLDQHLQFNEDTRTLKVFTDAVWLQCMCKRFRCESKPSLPEQGRVSGHDKLLVSSEPDLKAGGGSSKNSLPTGKLKGSETGCDLHARSLSTKRRITLNSDECGRRHAANDLLPLFEETLRTLDVLFPAWDPSTIQFLDEYNEQSHDTVTAFKLEDLYPQQQQGLSKFRFWRARLIELTHEYQSPPRDWRQIWKDRRNPMAFWTFWIGLMIFIFTIVFGIVASVLSGLALAIAKTSTHQGSSKP